MPFHVYIVENHMVLMNEDGDTFGHFTLDAGYAAAKRQIRKWSTEHAIYIGDAYRTLDEHFMKAATK